MYEIAIREPMFPAVIEPKVNNLPWYKRKISTIKLDDFYEYEENKMITYRIIPHASVAGNNKRLWRSIHKMYEMYEKTGSRLERNGFKFHYRDKDYLWIDVIFRQINGERKIEFYVSTTEYQAVKLKRRLENNMNITLQDSTIESIHIPTEDTIVQELKYLRHDIFSLNTNANERQTPISSILNTVDEMQFDGDMARLSICGEVEGRQKWIKSASWAREKLSKGKVPQRANFGMKAAVPLVKTGIAGLINEINSILTDTFQAISNSLFKSDENYKKDKVINKGYSLEDEINSTKLSTSSLDKINQPTFKSYIRVASHSKDRLTRETMSETLSLSVNDISENNELHGIKIKLEGHKLDVLKELNTLKLSNKTKRNMNINLVSADEMSKLALQMPTRDLQMKYADEMDTKFRVEVDIPAGLRDVRGIKIGVAEIKDQKIDIYMPVDNPDALYRAYTFIGGQGNGKDTAIRNWVVDGCMNHGISSVVIDAIVEDGERGMADGIRDSLPPDKIIDLDLGNGEWAIPMDLTEVISKLGRIGMSRFGDEMIDFMNIAGLTRSKKYLRDAAKASGGSLYNIKRIIEDEEFRASTIERLQMENNTRLANSLISWGSNDQLGNKIDPISERLDDFFGGDTLHDIFAQKPNSEVDFEGWIKEGKVIIIRIPNRKLGELATKTLVHWITLKTFMTRMLMNSEDKKNGCFIVFNEPEQYITEGLTKLMGRIGTEGRKERLGSLYAFHHWNKLPKSLQENLQGGGVQQFLFANDHTKTFDQSLHRFEDTIPIEQAHKLPAFHAIVSIRAGGELQPAFICRMKPPEPIKYNNSSLTKKHAKLYGKRWEELQDV